MSQQPMSLAELQREMAAAVMTPLTRDEDMRPRTRDGRDMNEVASSFIAPNSRLTAFERLEIYNRQYWYRVMGALADDFPAVAAVVGARAFEAMSVAYLSAHPSRSFSLRNLGSKLVDWLAANPQFAGRRHRLALDVARIEWAYIEAFDSGERTPLTVDQIATLDAGSRLALQPHVQLIALSYQADDLVVALHDHEKRQTSEAGVKHEQGPEAPVRIPKLRARPTWVAAHRVDLLVYYRRLRREEFLTLRSLRNGWSLAEAIETGFADSQTREALRPQMVREWFSTWAELGWICAPDLDKLMQQ